MTQGDALQVLGPGTFGVVSGSLVDVALVSSFSNRRRFGLVSSLLLFKASGELNRCDLGVFRSHSKFLLQQ